QGEHPTHQGPGDLQTLLAGVVPVHEHAEAGGIEVEPGGGRHRGVNRTGRCLIPLMKLDRSRSGGATTSMSGRRVSNCSKMARISSRASDAPRQKWGPKPKATWLLGVRPTSNVSASAKTRSSRLADA